MEVYPLVNEQLTMERSTMLFMGKLTISTGPFSIVILVYQRVYIMEKPMTRDDLG